MQHVLDVKTEKVGEVDVVQPNGSLDTANVDVFNKAMQSLAAQAGRRVVVDCAGLTYVNSMCFALLNKYTKEFASRGGKLVFCRIPQKIAQIIHILGLDNTLNISGTVDEAMKAAVR